MSVKEILSELRSVASNSSSHHAGWSVGHKRSSRSSESFRPMKKSGELKTSNDNNHATGKTSSSKIGWIPFRLASILNSSFASMCGRGSKKNGMVRKRF